ncbi:pyrroline-5-carboxylate reductase [Homoserinimonas aerilata]|uniref:Pyrroline-5-carboxylate reductase n=1 Tax=Homoserinimonas aerilata TaxID=1162970 RepID=A0A542YA62_9MICO|nr:pyrroline-5-carboxylate reductase [Homoserinimonas aerilata]TQL44965.1 pyrroline-5-carboxylate reductase [Homoserinimonas aerilata]
MTSNQAITQTHPTITILGAGAMGSAILDGLLAEGRFAREFRVTNRRRDSLLLPWPAGVTAFSTEDDRNANRAAVEGAELVLLGVKPSMVDDLLAEIADALEPGAVVVSLAAGVTTAMMESFLPEHVAVVRSMSNTPAGVGFGMTAIARGSRVSDAQFELVGRMFRAVGEVLVLPEEKLDAVTAVSGSGPAYVYYMIESFARTAADMGFTQAEAETLVTETFRGAVELLRASGKSPERLRLDVTSPGGTTERAIGVLENADLSATFAAAIAAAAARSKEMSAGR